MARSDFNWIPFLFDFIGFIDLAADSATPAHKKKIMKTEQYWNNNHFYGLSLLTSLVCQRARQCILALIVFVVMTIISHLAIAFDIAVSSGGCTLIDAIIAENSDAATGSCSAGNGDDTIVLPANSTISLSSVSDRTDGATALPLITSKI